VLDGDGSNIRLEFIMDSQLSLQCFDIEGTYACGNTSDDVGGIGGKLPAAN
jgi:hypothetical protein